EGAAAFRHGETDGSGFAGITARLRVFWRDTAALAIVLRIATLGLRLRAPLLQFFLCTEAVVGMAAFDQAQRGVAVQIHALRLEVRALIPIDAQPAQPDEDAFHHLRRRALEVSVLDAEDERASVMSREQPVEQRGARPADMQVAGRRRRKAKTGGIRSRSC